MKRDSKTLTSIRSLGVLLVIVAVLGMMTTTAWLEALGPGTLVAGVGFLLGSYGGKKGWRFFPVAPMCIGILVGIALSAMFTYGSGAPQMETRISEIYRKRCDGGDMERCTNLGVMYETGSSVPQSDSLAVELYQRACDGGDLYGCEKLGVMYAAGRGVTQSDTRAVELYQRACDGGDMSGCSGLGWAYAHGRGVPQSATRAVEFYRRACDGGHSESCNRLSGASPGVRP